MTNDELIIYQSKEIIRLEKNIEVWKENSGESYHILKVIRSMICDKRDKLNPTDSPLGHNELKYNKKQLEIFHTMVEYIERNNQHIDFKIRNEIKGK